MQCDEETAHRVLSIIVIYCVASPSMHSVGCSASFPSFPSSSWSQSFPFQKHKAPTFLGFGLREYAERILSRDQDVRQSLQLLLMHQELWVGSVSLQNTAGFGYIRITDPGKILFQLPFPNFNGNWCYRKGIYIIVCS